jgi:sugar phosphate isomerase/epimerase
MTDFAFQLYSARNFPPLADTLRMVKDAGYTAVEGYGALYADEAKVKELTDNLSACGLTMPTGHFSLDMLEKEPNRALEIAGALGIETIYCPHIAADQRPDSAAGWLAFGQRLQEAGQPYRDAGLGFGWHNHDFEFRPTPDGTIPQMAIFEGGPDLEWEADLAWVAKGGADPREYVEAFGKRLTAVHLKDIAPEGQNRDEDGWADLGDGTVDWKRLMTALRATKCRYFVIEHDNPKDVRRFAERSIAAAQKL